jgi:hypothetical protein
MASGKMPNLPGMPDMSGMSGRAARKLAQQAAGAGGVGGGGGAAGVGEADFDMLSQLMGDGGELPASFPGLPASGQPKPVVSVNKGTKKKKKGGRVTPPKGR